MKSLSIGIAASLCLHVLLFAFFLFSQVGQKIHDRELTVEFNAPAPATLQSEERQTQPETAPSSPIALQLPKTSPPVVVEESQTVEDLAGVPPSIQESDTLAQGAPDDWQLNTLSFWAKKMALTHPARDSLLPFQKAQQNFSLKPLPKLEGKMPGMPGDRIERDLYKRNVGQQKPVPMANALVAGAQLLSQLKPKHKPHAPRMTFIPSKVEVEALNTIWYRTKATDQQIYAGLDSSIKITAEDLNSALSDLTDKGFVTRELVSPRNEFTLQTPVGGVGIETSAKNRRNRVYSYQSLIDRQEMLQFLNAALYQLENGMELQFSAYGDSLTLVRQLQERILRVSQNP